VPMSCVSLDGGEGSPVLARNVIPPLRSGWKAIEEELGLSNCPPLSLHEVTTLLSFIHKIDFYFAPKESKVWCTGQLGHRNPSVSAGLGCPNFTSWDGRLL
jgi:hypothetical protein